MSPLEIACIAYTKSSHNNVRGLFSMLVRTYQKLFNDNLSTTLLDEKDQDKELSKQRFSKEYAHPVISTLFSEYKELRTDFLHILLRQSTRTRATHALAISLMKEVGHDVYVGIEKNTGYGSRKSLLTTAIKLHNEDLFNEMTLCRYDLNTTDQELLSDKPSHSINTLFSEACKEASDISESSEHANYAIEFLLSQPFANTQTDLFADEIESLKSKGDDETANRYIAARDKVVIVNRESILHLYSKGLRAAQICADSGYPLDEYKEHKSYSHNGDYATNTIKTIMEGYAKQVELELGSMQHKYQVKNAHQSVQNLKDIQSVLLESNARDTNYLAPFFDSSFVIEVISNQLKEINRTTSMGKGAQLSKKISLTLSFFERLMGKESLLWEDPSHATRVLFSLSKTNYATFLVDHYLIKIGFERLASSVTGIEQAKFIMEAFSSDPITMASLIQKDSVRDQLVSRLSQM